MDEGDSSVFSTSFDGEDESPPGYYESTLSTPRLASFPPALIEHVYVLGAEKKQPWAFLKVNSRAKNATDDPLFVQGDEITGTVHLDLEKTEHIEAVTLQVRGETWGGKSWAPPELEAAVSFWSHTTKLWSTSMSNLGTKGSVKGSSKLKGGYTWPFSIRLPKKVMDFSATGDPVQFALPPCFSEEKAPIRIDYKIVVTFSRGWFRADNHLFTSFVYHPRYRPMESSTLRQLAYRERLPPPGPREDPDGWEVLRPASVVGTLFDAREVEVACVFALAKPLCYTRGTFIPFLLNMSSFEGLALDVFMARGSLKIRLVRIVHIRSDATSKPKRIESKVSTSVGTGIYWPLAEPSIAGIRKFEGEIPIKSDLKPSFDSPPAAVKYHVSLTLTAPGFYAYGGSDKPALTLSRGVTITSDLAPGPTPRSRVPYGRRRPSGGYSRLGIGMI